MESVAVKPDKKLKIISIEDDKYLSSSLKLWLEINNFEVIVAYDGKEGIEKIKAEKPNLVLLDLMLPIMDGFQVLEEMKKDSEMKSIPVLLLSNLSQNPDIQKAKEMGVSDYLVKADVSMKDIVEHVKKILENT